MSDVSERAEAMLAILGDRKIKGYVAELPRRRDTLEVCGISYMQGDHEYVMTLDVWRAFAAAPELVRDLLAEVRRLRGECGELFIEREALQAKIDAARAICDLYPGMARIFALDDALGEQ